MIRKQGECNSPQQKIKMNNYNPNIHHRKSIRLKGYDYSQAGLYFITICCEGRLCRFGNIENNEMKLNKYGTIAFDEWMKTPQLRPNVALGEFVIMPNHIHVIISLLGRGELHSPEMGEGDNMGRGKLHSPELGVGDSPEMGDTNNKGERNNMDDTNNKGECNNMGETHNKGECNNMGETHNKGECNSPLRGPSQTVGAIVRGYKSSVTKQLGLIGFDEKLWQRNFYEHIIRNEQSYQTISNYIINNPAKWQEDKFYIT